VSVINEKLNAFVIYSRVVGAKELDRNKISSNKFNDVGYLMFQLHKISSEHD
jgi:hypothetical protein